MRPELLKVLADAALSMAREQGPVSAEYERGFYDAIDLACEHLSKEDSDD